MGLQGQHLSPSDYPIQIGRQQSLHVRALHRHAFRKAGLRGHVLHGITSTLLPPPATRFPRLSSFSGAVSPSCPPTSRTYGASRCFGACRPRVNLDFTVPNEICRTSAISSYDISSRSRRISVVR